MRDERGDMRGATQAFLHSRDLDIDMGLPPWAPSRESFVAIAKKAIAALNPVLRRYVDVADVYISDVPGMELVAEGVDPRALVLLDGLFADEVPRGDRTEVPCTRIFVYAINVARLAGSVRNNFV